MKKHTEFRHWLQEKWFEHKEELMLWEHRLPEYDDKYYFNKHKWMLRRMFKEEKKDV
jgi:predicted acyl esterase